MNRRYFMKALCVLGFFGFSKFIKAEKPTKVYKYAKFIHNCDKAIMDEFREIIIVEDSGAFKIVPILWANDDSVTKTINSENIELRCPVMNIYNSNVHVKDSVIYCNYSLGINTFYKEHMNQILEQTFTKFFPIIENKFAKYNFVSAANNYSENNEEQFKLLKYKLNIVAELKGRP